MKEFFTSRLSTLTDFIKTQHIPLADWKNIFTASYWKESLYYPSPYYLFGVVVTIIVVILIETWRRYLKKLHQATPIYEMPIASLANLNFFIVLLSAAYVFFRVIGVSYLSGRSFYGLIILSALIWIGWQLIYLRRVTPSKRRSHLERERFFRYLPNTKPVSLTKVSAKKGK